MYLKIKGSLPFGVDRLDTLNVKELCLEENTTKMMYGIKNYCTNMAGDEVD